MKRVNGNPEIKLIECTNPIQNKWRIRWDVLCSADNTSYMEAEFNHQPSIDEIKKLVITWYNDEINKSILSGFVYEDSQVWLSSENQFNYKAAYDLAVQTGGQNLPVLFKFATDDEPVYKEFRTIDNLTDFYLKTMNYIQGTLAEGWRRKDQFDRSLYEFKKL